MAEGEIDLDREKLTFEKEKFVSSHRLEQQKLIWVLVTVAVSIAILSAAATTYASLLDNRTKENEIRLRAYELERQYLTNFVDHAPSENIQTRVDFAQYVSEIAQDPQLHEQWSEYHDKISVQYRDAARFAVRHMIVLGAQEQRFSIEQRIELASREDCILGVMGLAANPGSPEFAVAFEDAADKCKN
ncbi:MAG: hypothetical protein ABJQ14_00640 [Hyphomicrobiales bacterium]